MTREEIMALTNEELRGWAWSMLFTKPPWRNWVDGDGYAGIGGEQVLVADYPHDIAAAMDLFNDVYSKSSPLHGGAWVLGTVDDGKDCSQATLLLHLPWRARLRKGMKTGHVDKVDKYQAKTKIGEMARAITLVYVIAMEDAK